MELWSLGIVNVINFYATGQSFWTELELLDMSVVPSSILLFAENKNISRNETEKNAQDLEIQLPIRMELNGILV